MLELACRMGDTKNAMILLNQILEGFAMFDGNSMAIVRMCNLLQQEVLKTISVRRPNRHTCAAVLCHAVLCRAAFALQQADRGFARWLWSGRGARGATGPDDARAPVVLAGAHGVEADAGGATDEADHARPLRHHVMPCSPQMHSLLLIKHSVSQQT